MSPQRLVVTPIFMPKHVPSFDLWNIFSHYPLFARSPSDLRVWGMLVLMTGWASRLPPSTRHNFETLQATMIMTLFPWHDSMLSLQFYKNESINSSVYAHQQSNDEKNNDEAGQMLSGRSLYSQNSMRCA